MSCRSLSFGFSESPMFFFFSSRRRHTRLTCDWSSDVCSSDLSEARREFRLRVVRIATMSPGPLMTCGKAGSGALNLAQAHVGSTPVSTTDWQGATATGADAYVAEGFELLSADRTPVVIRLRSARRNRTRPGSQLIDRGRAEGWVVVPTLATSSMGPGSGARRRGHAGH